MILHSDQQKDLRPIKANEFTGGYFYRKEEDGSFSTALVTKGDLERWGKEDPGVLNWFREEVKKMCKAGRYFIRINKPWHSFSGSSGEQEWIIPVFDKDGNLNKNHGVYPTKPDGI